MSRRIRLETPDGALWLLPAYVAGHMDQAPVVGHKGVEAPRTELVVTWPVGDRGNGRTFASRVYVVCGRSDDVEQALQGRDPPPFPRESASSDPH